MNINNFDAEHYWEIEKAEYPLKRIINAIQRAGFKIRRTHRAFENSYHRFFLKKEK